MSAHWHQWRLDCERESCACGAYRPRARTRRDLALVALGLGFVALVGMLARVA